MTRATRRHALALTLAFVGATTLAACTTPESGRDRPMNAAGPVDPADRPELKSFYQQELKWNGCGDFQCAELTVPVDYANPANGKTFVLPVAKAAVGKPAERLGSLVTNPGGPGVSGVTSLLEEGMTESIGADVRARFDIVSFDPRGVGGSSPALTCGGDEKEAQETPGTVGESPEDAPASAGQPFDPKSEAERAEALAGAKADADACAKGSAAILRHVGTEDVARDMDVLRAALGESSLTYLGWSYGTSVGTSYAEQFPRRVRAMVLDGAVDPSLDWSKRAVSQAVGFRRAVDDYAAHCAEIAAKSCPGNTPEKIRGLIDGLYERTARDPLPVEGDAYGFDATRLLDVIVMSMYVPETQWKELSEALADAGRGNGTKLAKLENAGNPGPDPDESPSPDASESPSETGLSGRKVPSDNSDAALQAVTCIDVPHPRDEQAYWDALAPADQAAGKYGRANLLTSLTCKDWPTGTQKPHRVSAEGVAPVLVVGTTGDAATPYEEASSLASQFPGGMLLTYKGLGHTAYGRGNSCVTQHVGDYLIDRKAVPSGTSC